ncbi:MAG: nucleotidyltransferase domain-containing protein [Christensenellaceae bacterium]|jgi:predicted nucleotidyltransferase|nr:nucleotidyltransferase domain-containing protein [Christensenellaceae bacterium]
MLDKNTIKNIVLTFAQEVKKILQFNAVIVFGSYVNGQPTEDSDIDVAIIINDVNIDWYNTMVKLCEIARKVNCYIEPHLISLNNDKSGFAKHIIETGMKVA